MIISWLDDNCSDREPVLCKKCNNFRDFQRIWISYIFLEWLNILARFSAYISGYICIISALIDSWLGVLVTFSLYSWRRFRGNLLLNIFVNSFCLKWNCFLHLYQSDDQIECHNPCRPLAIDASVFERLGLLLVWIPGVPSAITMAQSADEKGRFPPTHSKPFTMISAIFFF